MRRLLQILLFAVIVIFAAGAVLVMLPFAKEGTSYSELPMFLGVAAAALALAGLWWLAVSRSLGKSLVVWLILSLPLIVHGGTAWQLISGRIEAQRFEKFAAIMAYDEAAIEWPGFDGPVGLKIAFTLRHPAIPRGLILAPEIRMAPDIAVPRDSLYATQTSASGYFKDYYLDADQPPFALLKPPLFQRVFENPHVTDPNHKWLSSVPFSGGTETRVAFNLLPGTVEELPERTKICLGGDTAGIPLCLPDQKPEQGCASRNRVRVTEPAYAEGGDLTALWLAAGPDVIDLSRQLSGAMRQASALQNDPGTWTAMHKRLEPDGLTKAGYTLCPPGETSHTSSRVCYCRAE